LQAASSRGLVAGDYDFEVSPRVLRKSGIEEEVCRFREESAGVCSNLRPGYDLLIRVCYKGSKLAKVSLSGRESVSELCNVATYVEPLSWMILQLSSWSSLTVLKGTGTDQ
jgi:hypothetical protein